MVVRVKCEGEWNSLVVLSFAETCVVLTVDQFSVRDDAPLEQKKLDGHVC